ncbi:MAG: hypothetical protein ACO1OG_10155 [Devosia sp.]
MAAPDRDTVYSSDDLNRTVYTRESSATGWFVGIVVALALLAIGYLVFSANSGPSTSSTTINNTPAIEAPATGMDTAPMTGTETTPMAPAVEPVAPVETAPATEAPAPVDAAPADAAPATETPVAP